MSTRKGAPDEQTGASAQVQGDRAGQPHQDVPVMSSSKGALNEQTGALAQVQGDRAAQPHQDVPAATA